MAESIKYNYLVRQYKNRIYSYAFYMLRNRMDADDISQEVFIRIWKNMGNFSLASAKSWVMKTTHNLCLDYLRRKQTALSRYDFMDEEKEDKVINSSLLKPDESAHLNLMDEVIKDALMKVPENLRSIFIMYEIQGFKYEEISRILDLPLNTVKVYLMRGRKKLQYELRTYKPEEVIING